MVSAAWPREIHQDLYQIHLLSGQAQTFTPQSPKWNEIPVGPFGSPLHQAWWQLSSRTNLAGVGCSFFAVLNHILVTMFLKNRSFQLCRQEKRIIPAKITFPLYFDIYFLFEKHLSGKKKKYFCSSDFNLLFSLSHINTLL